MNLIKHHKRIVVEDSILKYHPRNTFLLPSLTKVSLSVSFQDAKASAAGLLDVLSFHKTSLTQSKKHILSLNLKKGEVVGCKLVLRKKSIMEFLERFLLEILPLSKSFEAFSFQKNSIMWQLKDVFVFEDTSILYMYLQSHRSLDIIIEGKHLNSNFFQGFRFPVFTEKK